MLSFSSIETMLTLPPEYDEELRLLCPFCGKEVSTGRVEEKTVPVGFHTNPPCHQWTVADNIVQYMMLVKLKMRADSGLRERN